MPGPASLASTVISDTSAIALGIVCPMANEEATAAAFASAVLDACAPYSFRSVRLHTVVDRASTDRTRDVLRDLAAIRPEVAVVWAPENRHVVDAYVRGYREAIAAGADWILEIDAGFSHQPADIPRFFDAMTPGVDCVYGTRFSRGGSVRDSPRRRTAISRIGGATSNVVLGLGLHDPTGGFELFRRDVLVELVERGIRSEGPFFQTELKAYARHRSVVEVPITYRAASHAVGPSAIADSVRNLARLVGLRIRRRL